MSREELSLPPGQRELAEFPRFGVIEFARRPLRSTDVRIEVRAPEVTLVFTAEDFLQLPRTTLVADFHCAAGWSHRRVRWSGYRFVDLWNALIAGRAQMSAERTYAVLRCRDGYRTSLPLTDLFAPDVLIADRMNDRPLSVEHGFPLRLLAPAHYGYKSAKHLVSLELRPNDQPYRPLLPRFMEHPRARVDLEEREQLLPGWLLRYLFRPLIQPIIRRIKAIGMPPQV